MGKERLRKDYNIDPEIEKAMAWRDFMCSLNYKERPVDIIDFLEDDYFLGKVTGRMKHVFPGWWDTIAEIGCNDMQYLVVVTGSIGTGKTMLVCGYCLPYIIYRVSCLKDPWEYFGRQKAGKMQISFFNLTKSLSGSRGFAYMQQSIQSSPWFRERAGGRMVGKNNPIMELPDFEWVLSSPYAKGFGTLGGNVIAGVMDEVDSPNESEGQRKRVLQAYDATVRRFESRFVKEEKSMGRFFLVASKQDELSFLEVFIADMKGSDKVVVYDKAQWEVRPSSDYCGERFLVSVGDAFTPPKLITAEEKNAEMEKNFKVIEIPVEHKFEFERDPIGALRDLAGISVKGLRLHKFVPGERFILAGFDNTKEDPVAFESMDIGLDEETELIQYIDLNKIRTPFDVPRCIHIDIAFSEDALALACSGIAEWRDMDVETPEGTFKRQAMPIVETDFVVRLKAKEGDRIPLHKIIKLILDLRSRKLNIRIVTIDLRVAAESSLQQLQRAGVTAEYMSVDKDNKAYIDWRHLLYDGRWRCHHQKWLHFELKNLEFDRVKNKINHPDKVKDMEFMEDGGVREMVVIGSKDCADAMVGSVYQALITGKVPVSAETVREQLGKIGGAAKGGGGLNPYSFIKTDRGPKHGSGSQVIKTGESTAPGGVEKMKEALKKLSRGKGGAGTIKWH